MDDKCSQCKRNYTSYEIKDGEIIRYCKVHAPPSILIKVERYLELTDVLDDIATLTRERDELQHTLDLCHAADMRAIERWREGHPERELTMPDQASLCVWLLERLTTTERERDSLRSVCAEAYQVVGALGALDPSTVPMLGNLSAAAQGEPIPHESCLPYLPPDWMERIRQAEREREEAIARAEKANEHKILVVRNRFSKGHGTHYVQAHSYTALDGHFTLCGCRIGRRGRWSVLPDTDVVTCPRCHDILTNNAAQGGVHLDELHSTTIPSTPT